MLPQLGHAAQDTAPVKLLCWRVHAQREGHASRSNPKRSLPVSVPGCEPGPVAMRTDNKRTAGMLERARELAARGHQPLMIEAVLAANGFLKLPSGSISLTSTKN
jgi:hypothetical protein